MKSFRGQVLVGRLGPRARHYADLLKTAWLIEPRALQPYGEDAPAGGECEPPGPGHAYYCSLDDTISYDYDLLRTLDGFAGELSAVVILSHEWGHVNQQRFGILDDLTRTPVENELHADCQAGAFAAMLQAWGELSPDDISDAFYALCHFADPQGFFDPTGHGNCTVRRDAFMYGYRTAQFRIDDLCGKEPAKVVVTICEY